MKIDFKKISKIRTEKKISQEEIVEETGLSRVAYTYFENGKTKPESLKLKSAVGIAKALGVPFNELFEIENPKEQELKNEIARLQTEIENYKGEVNFIWLEKEYYQDQRKQELKSHLLLNQSLESLQKNFNEINAKLLLCESFNFLDNKLFAAKFPDLTGNRPLIKVFDFEIVENFFYQFGAEIDEILNYIDLKKFRNDNRLNKLLSKFELSKNTSELFNEIEKYQASLRKELNL